MTDSTPSRGLTPTQWLICAIAAIGFAFDIYELLMAPLVGAPALAELLGVPPDHEDVVTWTGYVFWFSALSGGIFGLIGGYLTDLFGRRRVLVWSILLYAFSALTAGFSTSALMFLVLRCTTMIGVCVEFVAAVAWLAELFPEPERRERILGYTQAFSSIGGLLVTGANTLVIHFADSLPAIQGGHSEWRYTLISGVIPAIPLIVIRPFLPESPAWREKRAAGTLRRPSILEIFRPEHCRVTVVTTILFASCYGVAFGAIQLTPQLITPGLPEVQAARKSADEAAAPLKKDIGEKAKKLVTLPEGSPERKELAAQVGKAKKEVAGLMRQAKQEPNKVQFFQELGGLLGRFVLAFLAVRMVSRRRLLWVFQVPGLVIVPLVYYFPARDNLDLLKWGMFAVGFCTVSQFSFWGNYLPRVFPTHLRGTGESFAANVGGRMIGTFATVVTTNLVAPLMRGATSFERVALAACVVALGCYLIGFVTSFWLPEPKSAELPD